MSQKFSTTNPKNFMGQNPEAIPDWMANVADNLKVKDNYTGDWATDERGVFAEYHPTVQRQYTDLSADPREIAQSYTAQKLKSDAKIALAKFLTGKRYAVRNSVAGTDFATLQVVLDVVPANFVFSFEVRNGKLASAATFLVDDSEYPFSKAGFEECLSDIKSGTLKTTAKAESLGKPYLINREEVIRRYNGSLREATDMINRRLEEGAIVGVGSNTYASFFDVNHLFPQQEKTLVQAAPEFEFVKNTEHVSMNPHKSAQVLSLDAIRILSNTFSDVTILSSYRDGNELLVMANVLNDRTGVRTQVSFSFDIENEALGGVRFGEVGEQRMGIRQLVEALTNNGNEILARYLEQTKIASQRANGIVLSRRDVKHKLSKVVDANTVDKMIDRWIQAGLVQPLNSTTFSTNLTFEELLSKTDAKVISREAATKIASLERHFGQDIEIDTEESKPIVERVRLIEEAESSDELRLANFVSQAGRHFKQFTVDNFSKLNDNTYNVALSFVDRKTGTRNNIPVNVQFEGAKVANANASVQGKLVPLNSLANAFKANPLLTAYLQDGRSYEAGPILISSNKLQQRLANLISESDIPNVVKEWTNNGWLKSIGENLFASQHSFEEMLRATKSAKLMSAEEMQEIAEIKKFFGDGLHVKADYDKDTGVRTVQVHITDEDLFRKANARLAQEFKHYQPLGFTKDDDNYILRVELSNEDTGLRHNVDFIFHFDDDKIASCYMGMNGKKVSLASVKKAFALNEALSRYLESSSGKHHVGPMILKVAEFGRRLRSVSSESLESVLSSLASRGMVSYVDSETIASQHSFEELLQASNVVALSDEEIEDRIARSARDRGMRLQEAYVKDTGERQLAEGPWSAKRLTIHAQAKLGSTFRDFEILDASLINGSSTGNILYVNAAFVNPFSGLREKLAFHFGLEDGRPNGNVGFVPSEFSSAVASIDQLGDYLMNSAAGNEAVNQFTSIHGAAQRSQKGILTKGSLESQLQTVVASESIGEVIDTLVRINVLKPLNSTTYACDYTMSELVNQLAKLQRLNLEAGRNQVLLAVRDERKVNTSPEYHVKETDTRSLEDNASKLAQLLGETKSNVQKAIEAAQQGKRITRNKYAQLTSALQQANNVTEIQNVVNELKRYFE